MTTATPAPQQRPIVKNIYRNASDAVYGLGLIGAAIYFIQQAPTFWLGVLGILKAIVWPAFVVYRLLEFLKIG
ncbi:MAG TPA: hypothetical protein VIU38_03735 [Anaerolineales bacterium]